MAKLSDIATATNPISGKTFSVLDIGHIWSLALGAGVVLAAVSLGQRVFGKVGAKVPFISTTIQDPIAPAATPQQQIRVI